MPDKTLEAFADHGEVGDLMDPSGAAAENSLKEFEEAGIDLRALAQRLQDEGKESFDKAWKGLLETIADKRRVKTA
jgi:transaldolase